MPLLITPQIIAATIQMEPGWTLLSLKEYKEKSSKKSPGVIDYQFIFEGLDGPGKSDTNKGRTIVMMISGNALTSGVSSVANQIMSLSTSLTGESAENLAGEEINFKSFIGEKVWGEVKDEVYNGQLRKVIALFTPEDIVPF